MEKETHYREDEFGELRVRSMKQHPHASALLHEEIDIFRVASENFSHDIYEIQDSLVLEALSGSTLGFGTKTTNEEDESFLHQMREWRRSWGMAPWRINWLCRLAFIPPPRETDFSAGLYLISAFDLHNLVARAGLTLLIACPSSCNRCNPETNNISQDN